METSECFSQVKEWKTRIWSCSVVIRKCITHDSLHVSVCFTYIYSYTCNTTVFMCICMCKYTHIQGEGRVIVGKQSEMRNGKREEERQRLRWRDRWSHRGPTPRKWAHSNLAPHAAGVGWDQQKHSPLCGDILTSRPSMTSSKALEVIMHFHRREVGRELSGLCWIAACPVHLGGTW